MMPRTSDMVIDLATRNKDGDVAEQMLHQDGLQTLRILSTESVVSFFSSDASPTLTEDMEELELARDARSAPSCGAAEMRGSPGQRARNARSSVCLAKGTPEMLRSRHNVSREPSDKSGLESPVSPVCVDKGFGQEWTPPDMIVPSAVTLFSEKENPGSTGPVESHLPSLQTITRAPMKPARISLLNRTVKSSSARRRLNFDAW